MKASHLGSFSSRSTLSPTLLIFLSLFSNSFQGKKTTKKWGKEEKRGGGEKMRAGRRLVITAMQNGHLPCLLAFEIQSIVWDGK